MEWAEHSFLLSSGRVPKGIEQALLFMTPGTGAEVWIQKEFLQPDVMVIHLAAL